jgi:hypothetical protein
MAEEKIERCEACGKEPDQRGLFHREAGFQARRWICGDCRDAARINDALVK